MSATFKDNDNHVFKNGNIAIRLSAGDFAKTLEGKVSKKAKAFAVACGILDQEFDMLCVRDDKTPDLRKSKNGKIIRYWTMYSFQTAKEYEFSEDDLTALQRGYSVRLKGRPASDETKAAMLWIPSNNSAM